MYLDDLKLTRVLPGVLALLLLAAPPVQGDIFHLRGGGTVNGQLLETRDGHYHIRSVVGIVRLPVEEVEQIEPAETPFAEYEQRLAAAPDTPAGQFELATWCEEQGLRAERRKHLERVLTLDPDHAAARQALGYVRVGDLWVDGRRILERKPRVPDESDQERDPERLARAIQVQWYRHIRAVRDNLLNSSRSSRVEEGRSRIRKINDPLAILPLVEILSTGGPDQRALLVEMLGAFTEDEATMNLALLALIDREASIRRAALSQLKRRGDPRVVAQYREALKTGNAPIIARAAQGLGELGALEAVPDLVEQLTERTNKWIEVPVRRYIRVWQDRFTGATIVHSSGPTPMAIHNPSIGLWQLLNVAETEWWYQPVTVYRTEVLEALRKITGQDFGFEQDQWRHWYEEQRHVAH